MRRKNTSVGLVILLLIIAGIYTLIQGPLNTSTTPSSGAAANPPTSSAGSPLNAPDWGHQTKTSGCVASGGLPDPACTPGDIFPDAIKEKICVPGYTQTVRDVPDSLKNKVYAEYDIKTRTPGQYEVDHFVSLELGGSNDVSNLFPEAASPKPGFHEKDKVENYLHDQVCSGVMTLLEAQIKIATNWLEVYKSMPNQ
jgi:hypothetical protein